MLKTLITLVRGRTFAIAEEVARANFFRFAIHVWPRILRLLREEIE